MSKYDEAALAATLDLWQTRLVLQGLAPDVAATLARTIATEVGTAYAAGEAAGMAFASQEIRRAMGGGA